MDVQESSMSRCMRLDDSFDASCVPQEDLEFKGVLKTIYVLYRGYLSTYLKMAYPRKIMLNDALLTIFCAFNDGKF